MYVRFKTLPVENHYLQLLTRYCYFKLLRLALSTYHEGGIGILIADCIGLSYFSRGSVMFPLNKCGIRNLAVHGICNFGVSR